MEHTEGSTRSGAMQEPFVVTDTPRWRPVVGAAHKTLRYSVEYDPAENRTSMTAPYLQGLPVVGSLTSIPNRLSFVPISLNI